MRDRAVVMAGIKWTLRDSTIFSVQFSANTGFKWHNQHAYTGDKTWPDAAIFYRALFLEIVGRMEVIDSSHTAAVSEWVH